MRSYLARDRAGRLDLEESEGGGTRTHDQRIKSPLLYRLSYALKAKCSQIEMLGEHSGNGCYGGYSSGVCSFAYPRFGLLATS